MGLKSVINAGTKGEKYSGPIVKLSSDGSTIKLTSEALALLGVGLGEHVFFADGDEAGEFYVAGNAAKTVGGAVGSKLGVVGEKKDDVSAYRQLQISHGTMGKKMLATSNTFRIEGEATEYNGLNFFALTAVTDEAEKAQVEEAVEEEATTTKRSRAVAE